MSKKTKLTELKQSNGNLDTQPTTLDQIWGDTGLSKYGTLDETEYTNQLSEMNKSDLFAHAATLGIMPIDNRERLVKSLLRNFKSYVASFQMPKALPGAPKAVSKEVSKILSEGR